MIAIPKQISQKNLSINYLFYDPVIPTIVEGISKEMLNFYNLRNQLNLRRMEDDENFISKIINQLNLDKFI